MRKISYLFLVALLMLSLTLKIEANIDSKKSKKIKIQNSSTTKDYILGPEDEISIYVWRNEELSFKSIIVRPNGYISFPFLGEFKVMGFTCGELEKKLIKSLRPYIRNPKVSVNVIKKKLYRVYIVGQVNKPGVYDIRRAKSKVSEILALSEGPTEKAALHRCLIQRKGKTIPVNLESYLKGGKTKNDIVMQEEDVLVVPEMNHRIAVIGDVKKPGIYDLKEGDNLLQAVTTAGWFSSRARVSNIQILRKDKNGKEKRIKINLRKIDGAKNAKDFMGKIALNCGDIIYVPQIGGPNYKDITSTFNALYFFRRLVDEEL